MVHGSKVFFYFMLSLAGLTLAVDILQLILR